MFRIRLFGFLVAVMALTALAAVQALEPCALGHLQKRSGDKTLRRTSAGSSTIPAVDPERFPV